MKELYWKCWRGVKRIKDFFLYDIKQGTENLIKWFPIIWNDRDWDRHFIFKILRFKLQNVEECIRNGCHLNCEKDADDIKLCYLLLDRIIKDEYYENASKEFSEKWGESDFEFIDVPDKPEYQELNIRYENDPNNEREEERGKEVQKLFKHENYLKNQDINMLFDKMRKHILKWWD